MDSHDYKLACARPMVLRRGELELSQRLLVEKSRMLAARIRKVLEGPSIAKPPKYRNGEDHFEVEFEVAVIEQIVAELGFLEATAAERGESAHQIADLLDRWNRMRRRPA